MRIGHKLIAGYLALIVLIALGGHLAVRKGEQALEQSITESAVALSAKTLQHIDHHIFDQVVALRAYVQAGAVQDAVTTSNRAFEALDDVQAHIDEADKEWTSAPAETLTPFMEGLVASDLSEEFRRRMGLLETRHGRPVVAELFVTNKYGANVAQSGRTTDYRQDDEAWWQQAKIRDCYVGDVEYDASAGVYAIAIAARIDDAEGNFAGVIKEVLDVSEMIRVAGEMGTDSADATGGGKTFKLVNGAGKLVYSTRPYTAFEDVPDVFGAREIQVALRTDPERGELLCVRSISEGDADFEGLGWSLTVEQPTSEAFAPVRRLRGQLLVFGMTAAVIALVMGWRISRSISKPLSMLRQGAEVIASGNLDHRVRIETGDEIEELADGFNRMAQELQESYTSLEQKVADRTAHLEKEIAERKKVEETLRESRGLYRTLVDNIGLGITLIDCDHKIVAANRWMQEKLRKPVSELIGTHCFREFEKREEVCGHCPGVGAMATGKPAEVESEGVLDDGTRFPVLIKAFPVPGSDGEATGFIEVIEDVSERKRVEKEIDTLTQRIEFILGATGTGIDIIDSAFNVRYIDPEWGKVYGDPAGRKCYEYFMGRSEVCPGCGVVQALETKAAVVTEEALAKEGNRPVQVMSTPFQDEKGEWLVAEVNVDITERKRAEEALRASEGKLDAMLNSIGDQMSMMDEDLNITWANDIARKIFGDDIVGKKCYEAYHRRNEPCEPHPCVTLKAFRDGMAHEHDTEVKAADGTALCFHCTANVALRDEEGNPTAVLEISRDTTERKRAEEEIRRYAGQLESLNAELKRSNRDLQDFMYTVSHDLQEPLRKIHTFGEFLVEDCGEVLPEKGREHLGRIQSATVRMKVLIEHLLALSRVGTRGGELSPVQPRAVIDEAVETLSEKLRECGGRVSIKDGMPAVMADAVQLGQVFQNLMGNAVKFRSPERPLLVSVTAQVEGDDALFSVSDNGIGIEERFLEKVFGAFQRLHTREEYEGAGVGLALCRKVIQRHGGRIWVESEPGRGSTFRFSLPVAPPMKETRS